MIALGALPFLLTAATMILGYVLFGIAMLRAGTLPRVAIVMLVAGTILGVLPPHPLTGLPWAGLVLGGVLYGAALVWLGSILWMRSAPKT